MHRTGELRDNNRVVLVIDIEHVTHDHAYWLCRARIHAVVDHIRQAGYTAHAVRIDINGHPHIHRD